SIQSTCDQSTKVATAVAHEHDVLSRRNPMLNPILDGFRSDVMAGIQDDQVLDSANDAPVAAHADFSLIAGVEPTVANGLRGSFRTIPVARENIGAIDKDLVVLAQLHLDAGNAQADASGFDGQPRIVHRTDAGRFGKAVRLQHGNAEHQKELL